MVLFPFQIISLLFFCFLYKQIWNSSCTFSNLSI
uniref:Uncharacterized protein n=1 Tax=Arundo donax TaxID=35708 RepID=A0A0A9FQ49_ARUDO